MGHAPVGPLSSLDPTKVNLHFKEYFEGKMRHFTYQDKFAFVPRHLAMAYFGVEEEPRLCFRAKSMMKTYLCNPFFQKDGAARCACECFIDMRLFRLKVPVANFPRIYSVVKDQQFP